VADAAPAHVRDVEKAVEAVEVDKGTVVGDVLDGTATNIARLDLLEKIAALFEALLFDQFTAGNDNVLPVRVNLEDFKVIGLANILVQVLGRLDVDLRSRKEGIDANIDDQTPLDLGLDPTS
jgi:hypothetical protein